MKKMMYLLFCLICLQNVSFAQFTSMSSPCEGPVEDIIISGNRLLAGTYGYGIFYSTDNGDHWQRVLNTPFKFINRFDQSNDTIYACAYEGLFISTDNGITWSKRHPMLTRVMQFYTSSGNWYVGRNVGDPSTPSYQVVCSKNGGITWGDTLNQVSFNKVILPFSTAGNTVYVARGSSILSRHDTATLWSSATVPASLGGLQVNANRMLAFYNGRLFTKTLTASVWDTLLTLGPSKMSFYQFDSIMYFTKAMTGQLKIYRSADSGLSWSLVSTLTNSKSNRLTVNGNNMFLSYEDIGIYRSLNNGQTWEPAVQGLTAVPINKLLVEGNNMMIQGDWWQMYVSKSHGALWEYAGQPDGWPNSLFGLSDGVFFGGRYRVKYYSNGIWKEAKPGLTATITASMTTMGAAFFANHSTLKIEAVDTNQNHYDYIFDYSSVSSGQSMTELIGKYGKSKYMLFGDTFLVQVSTDWSQTPMGTLKVPPIKKLTCNYVNQLFGLGTGSSPQLIRIGAALYNSPSIDTVTKSLGLTDIVDYAFYQNVLYLLCKSGKAYYSRNYGNSWVQMSTSLIPADDTCYAIAADSDRVFIGTYASGLWSDKISVILGIDDLSNTEPIRAEVYPNPAGEKVWINLPDETHGVLIKNISLLDLTGKEVAVFANINNWEIQLNTSSHPNGYYFLLIQLNNGNTLRSKLVKQ